MAKPRAWDLNLEEMERAVKFGENTELLEESTVVPVVSGFTPINQQPISSTSHKTEINSKTVGKCRAVVDAEAPVRAKKRKTLVPAVNQPSKRPKIIGTSDYSRKPSVFTSFQVRKPEPDNSITHFEQEHEFLTKGYPLLDVNPGSKLPTIHEHPLQEDGTSACSDQRVENTKLLVKEQRPALVESYQAAYFGGALVQEQCLSSPYSFQAFSDTALEFERESFNDGKDESTQHVLQSILEQSNASQIRETWGCSSKFEPPQSAQLPRATSEEPLAGSFLRKDGLSRPTIFSNDHDFDDAAFDDFDEVMEMGEFYELTRPAESRTSGCMVQSEGNFKDDLDDWPDDISMPDAVTIYEDGTQKATGREHGPHATDPRPVLARVSGNIMRSPQIRPLSPHDESDLTSSLVGLTMPTRVQNSSTPQTSPHHSSSPKLQWLAPKTFIPRKSQSKLRVQRPDLPHLVPTHAEGTQLPFARPPFPNLVLPRSPILGLSNATVIRTCFRVGEALNAATQASRTKIDTLIELYARVSASSREPNGGFKQCFRFADLFTDNAPSLSGTSTIWKEVGLWDQDSKVFLGRAGQGKLCRAMGRIKRPERQAGGWQMTVLSIWEVDWEDVGIAKGVVCS